MTDDIIEIVAEAIKSEIKTCDNRMFIGKRAELMRAQKVAKAAIEAINQHKGEG